MAYIQIFNFSHLMTEEQLDQIRADYDIDDVRVERIPIQLDLDKPIEQQVQPLVIDVLKHSAWADLDAIVLVNPPGFSAAAVLVARELYDSPFVFEFIRLKRDDSQLPPKWVLAEFFGSPKF